MTELKKSTMELAKNLFPNFSFSPVTPLTEKLHPEGAIILQSANQQYQVEVRVDLTSTSRSGGENRWEALFYDFAESSSYRWKTSNHDSPEDAVNALHKKLDALIQALSKPAEIKIAVTEADLQIAQNFWNLAGRMGKTRLGSGNYRVQQAMRAIAFCLTENKLPEAARKLCTKSDIAAIAGNDNYTNRSHRQTMFSAEEVSAATEAIEKCLKLTPIENLVGHKPPNGLTD